MHLLLQEFGSDQILQGATHAFEKGDITRFGAAGFLPAHQFVQISNDVFAGNEAVAYGNEQIAGFGERALVSVNDHSRSLNSGVVHFTRVRLKCADGIDVGAGPQQVTIEKWRL